MNSSPTNIPTARLTSGPIAGTLISLSAPMLVAIAAMMGFNLIDTFFVGRLGVLQLAAMTLTFPVVMVISTFTLGIGVGAMAVISRTIGEGDQTRIRRCATDALSLATLCLAVLTLAGLATVDPLFRFLGATDAVLPYVRQYMYLWYGGMVFYVVPMIGGNIVRSTGDTLTPSVVMLIGMAANAGFDPLFIFGWGPVPAMGIAGAAIAANVSRVVTLAATLWVLLVRERILARLWPGLTELLTSWKSILAIGLPVAVSNAIIPVALGIVTRIISRYGPESVAGFGVATRLEAFGIVVLIALSTGISPFVGQNFGAGNFGRIRKALNLARVFSLVWGGILFAIFLLLAKPLAGLFSSDPGVTDSARLYLWIVPVSLGLRGVHQIIWTALNVLGRPYDAMGLEFLLAICLWIPLAFAGGMLAGPGGVYAGLSISNIVAGFAAIIWVGRVLNRQEGRQ